jgi:hypothetical protein
MEEVIIIIKTKQYQDIGLVVITLALVIAVVVAVLKRVQVLGQTYLHLFLVSRLTTQAQIIKVEKTIINILIYFLLTL